MKIGITGCTSGLGFRLAEIFCERGFEIKALVRPTSRTGDLKKRNIEFVYGDICDYGSLISFVNDIDVCIHIAALVSGGTKGQYFDVNVSGTKNICDAVLSVNPECRVIYCSSIAIFRVKWFNKFIYSDYTRSKLKADQLVDRYMREKNLKAAVIYPGYMYGPDDKNFMPLVTGLLKKGLKYIVSGGEKNAPIIFIDDVCELFYLAATENISTGKKYIGVKGLNIGVHGFMKIIADKLGYPFPEKKYPRIPMIALTVVVEYIYSLLKIKSNPPVTMRIIGFLSYNFTLDDDLAFRELGWQPKTTIEDGLELVFQSYS